MNDQRLIVAGIDVGGPRKGFHAVELRDGAYQGQCASADPETIVTWCRDVGAKVIGVDAPCRWSSTGRARPAERALMAEKIWCFSSPTREAALDHPKQYYHWMLAGAELFRLLEMTHPLFDGTTRVVPTCFETFPHAITCALAGEVVSAKNKRRDRVRLLELSGILLPPKSSIDTVDAALCALTASHFAAGTTKQYGDAETGWMVVPDRCYDR